MAEGIKINLCKADTVMNSKGEWNGSKLPRMIVERGDQVELDPGDVNVRMMNWDTKPRPTKSRNEPVKRKDVSDSESDQIKTNKEGKNKDMEVLEVHPTKKLRMDWEVQEVRPGLINSFIEQAKEKPDVQEGDADAEGAYPQQAAGDLEQGVEQ